MIATLFFLHIQQKFQNLVLDRHIQHRYNLIHNQETQPEQQRPDNGNALQLTTKNSAGPYFKPKNKPQRILAPELTKKGRLCPKPAIPPYPVLFTFFSERFWQNLVYTVLSYFINLEYKLV